ncbi:N-acetylmuramoyl-L-alanine amidase [Parafrankia sp. FMc2]|uniref:peptidoglycan recognition protein family protein n=1 Tax=Parafrankia sp. FMc2 TaxID=3233196 RepID=UPI0034D5849F
MATQTRGLIPHVQMGTAPLFGWFSDPASGVSSHLWLGRDGEMDQYVALDDKAWAQGAGNAHWVSCECAGRDTDDYTPIQVQRLGELFAWGIREFGWRPQITDSTTGYGLGTHRMGGAAWGGHSCPGNIRANRRGDILAVALGRSTPPSPALPEDDVPLTEDDLTRASARFRKDLWDDVKKAETEKEKINQGSAGQTIGSAYLKAGNLQDRLSRVEAYLAGPFAAWTASQEISLREIRELVAGGTAADPGVTATVLERLDQAIAAFTAPRAYTLTPTGDPHA